MWRRYPLLHQLVEAAAFHDATLLEDEDAAGIAYGGQPMRDDEGGTPLHHLVERRVHLHLGHGIERACGFVKNEDRRIFRIARAIESRWRSPPDRNPGRALRLWH